MRRARDGPSANAASPSTTAVAASALGLSLFFGGWDIPFTTWDNFGPYTVGKFIATFGMFVAKVIFFVFFSPTTCLLSPPTPPSRPALPWP